jgi:excisionase family DNA binding protein
MSTLIDEHVAAELLACSVKTLRRWRWAGRELPFVKIGRSVRYDMADLAAYVSAQRKLAKASGT